MLIKKKFQKDGERNNVSTYVKNKNEKDPIDLPEIKVYKSSK